MATVKIRRVKAGETIAAEEPSSNNDGVFRLRPTSEGDLHHKVPHKEVTQPEPASDPEDEEASEEVVVRHIKFDNIDEFFVGYDTYRTTPECEKRLPESKAWWSQSNIAYKPIVRPSGVDEELIWRCLNTGRSIIISGKAGAGKSNLLGRFVANLEGTSISYALCAPTGIAAFNIGGETIHRRLGLGLAQDDPVSLFKQIKNRVKYAKTWKFLTGTNVLIIDEISMLHPDLFNKLDYLFRKARECELPFGGVILIVVGDFTQLGPIVPRDQEAASSSESVERFVLDTDVWKRMRFCRIFLDRSYRQSEGDPYLQVLNELRMGHLSESSQQLLMSRVGADVAVSNVESTQSEIDADDGETKQKQYRLEPVDMFPYKAQVDRCNKDRLDALVERDQVELKTFYPALKVAKREHAPELDSADLSQGLYLISEKGRNQLIDMVPIFSLTVAVGAQVMCRTNTLIDQGIFNGSTGIVTAIENDHISVLFVVNGKFMDRPADVGRAQFSVKVGKTAEVQLNQFPLSLAWGITVHKAQGLTLDSARVDARNCFATGQLYVALSRVRRLTDLSLIGFHPRSIMQDARAVRFEQTETDRV